MSDSGGADTGSGYWPNGSINRLFNAGNERFASAAVDINIPYSISVWVNQSLTSSDTGVLVSYMPSGYDDAVELMYLHSQTATAYRWETWDAGDAYHQVVIDTAGGGSSRQWEHYCVIVNSTGLFVYRNGTYVGTTTGPGTGSNTGSITIGNPDANTADGIIDELYIYNFSLSPTDCGNLSIGNGNNGSFYPFTSGGETPPGEETNITINQVNITSNQYPIYRNSTLLGWCKQSNTGSQAVNLTYRWFLNDTLSSGLCRQEQANESTSCGGLSTGMYGSDCAAFGPGLGYDGNRTTSSTYEGCPAAGMRLWYRIPSGATSASWELDWSTSIGEFGTTNFSLNTTSQCWNYNSSLLYLGIGHLGPLIASCCNDTSCIELGNTITSNAYMYLHEEAIYWNIGPVNYSNAASGQLLNKGNYSASYKKGDTIKLECTAFNETKSSLPLNSSAVTISNCPPSLSGISLNDTMANISSTLRCNNGSMSDIDADSSSFVYEWFVNGTSAGWTAQDLPISAFAVKGANITCQQKAYDGTNSSTGLNTSMIVQNYKLILYGSFVADLLNNTNHTLYVSANVTDQDGATDIKSTNATFTNGNCVNILNTTAGVVFGSKWLCTFTDNTPGTISIGFTDQNGSYIYKQASSSYPNTPPYISLSSPASGDSVATTRAYLNWTGSDANSDTLTYYVYSGNAADNLTLKTSTGSTYYYLDVTGGTYFWQINASDGYSNNISSTWNFSLRYPLIRFTANDSAGQLNVFNIFLNTSSQNLSINVTTGAGEANLTYERWYYRATATGFTDILSSLFMNGDRNITLTFLRPQGVMVHIYNENGSLASGTDVTLNFISESYNSEVTISTGIYNTDYLPSGSYMLEYSATGYNTERYPFTLNSTISVDIYLYLTPSSWTAYYITIYDEMGLAVEGYDVTALKYNTDQATYTFYQTSRTDSTGKSIMYFYPRDGWYKFQVTKDGSVYYLTEARQVYEDFFIIINTGSTSTLSDLGAVSGTLNYTNASGGYFTYYFMDTNQIAVQGCLRVQADGRAANICNTCVNSYTGIITCKANATNGTTLTASGIILWDGREYPLASYAVSFAEKLTNLGTAGVFLTFIIVIILAFIGLPNPAVSALLASVGLALCSILTIFPMPQAGVALSILIFGISSVLLMRNGL